MMKNTGSTQCVLLHENEENYEEKRFISTFCPNTGLNLETRFDEIL